MKNIIHKLKLGWLWIAYLIFVALLLLLFSTCLRPERTHHQAVHSIPSRL